MNNLRNDSKIRISYAQVSNILFVLSCIFVPLLLISINYSTIDDFYKYSVPLNNFEIWDRHTDQTEYLWNGVPLEKNELGFIGTTFDEIIEKKGSQCIATTSNYFCYTKPRFHENSMEGISQIVSKTNSIDGEMHFFPTEKGGSLFVIHNMTLINGESILIQFSNGKYFINNSWTPPMSFGEITEKFEYSAVLEKFDTFISHCRNPEGTRVTLIQYLGVQTIDDVDYFVTWHTESDSESGINCVYPQIIQHSIGHDFGL